MSHKEKDIIWPDWVQDIATADPCLGRVVKEAVVARDAAVDAGAAKKDAPKASRGAFRAAEETLNAFRFGRIQPQTDAAWKRASDSLRKFTEALDCAQPPAAGQTR